MSDLPLDFPVEPKLFLCIRKNLVSFTGNQINLDEFHCQRGPDCKWSKTGWFRNLGIECWACVGVLYIIIHHRCPVSQKDTKFIKPKAMLTETSRWIFGAHSLIIPTAKSIYNNYLHFMQIVITVGYCFPYDTENDPVRKHLVLTRVYLLVKWVLIGCY